MPDGSDITPMDQMRRQAQMLKSVLDSLGDGVAAIDSEGRFIHFNPAGAKLLRKGAIDKPATEWSADYGLYLSDGVTPVPVDELPLVRAARGEHVRDFEIFVRHEEAPQGIWLKVSAEPIRDERENVVGGVALFRDETQRRNAEQSLAAEREYLRYLIEAQDRDRRLTAYDLHDGVVQSMTGAVLRLEAFRSKQGNGLIDSESDLKAAIDALRDGLDEARRLIGGLRPPVIDREGVIGALQLLIDTFAARQGLQVDFVHDDPFARLPSLLETTIFRIVQESLHNVVRHAQSLQASVRLQRSSTDIQLEVRDEGVGFDCANTKGHRYGIRGIHERAALLGGTAVVESSPGRGTTIRVAFPLPTSTASEDVSKPTAD